MIFHLKIYKNIDHKDFINFIATIVALNCFIRAEINSVCKNYNFFFQLFFKKISLF